MADEQQDDIRIISGIILDKQNIRLKSSSSRIIRTQDLTIDPEKVCVVGGDSTDQLEASPPAIIIEKKNDKIYKISVKCPCGRHAELICEYENE